MKIRKKPNGCEMIFTDTKRMKNNKVTKCNKKELKYYCYTNGLFYCNACAHEIGQRNSALDFVKISSLTKSKLLSNE